MGDEIKRAVVKDDSLHFVRGEDVWSVKAEEGKEPNVSSASTSPPSLLPILNPRSGA
jgi:hypothetical protein